MSLPLSLPRMDRSCIMLWIMTPFLWALLLNQMCTLAFFSNHMHGYTRTKKCYLPGALSKKLPPGICALIRWEGKSKGELGIPKRCFPTHVVSERKSLDGSLAPVKMVVTRRRWDRAWNQWFWIFEIFSGWMTNMSKYLGKVCTGWYIDKLRNTKAG